MKSRNWIIPLALGAIAFIYYVTLSSKIFTWIFISADSADWLLVSNWWMVPQPLGSPLFLLLGQFLNIFQGDQVIKMTVLLSCLPSAITITLVYLIVKKLTSKIPIAITSSLVLLGSAIFLTQSTVLEEYAVAVMLLTAGIYFLIENKLKTGFVLLGLATAVHAVIAAIALLLWIGYAYKRIGWTRLLGLGSLFLIFGVMPYSLILILMYLDTPRLMAGGLDWYHLEGYFIGIGQGIVGTISVFDFPYRLLSGLRILLVSLGLAIIPLGYFLKDLRSVKKPESLSGITKYLLLVPASFALWYYFTCFDPGTWTFILFGLPSIVVMVGLGLSKLSLNQIRLVAACAVVLITVNGFLLNANKLAHDAPYATTYYEEVMDLPNGSAIVSSPGAFTMTTIYTMSEGKDVVPLIWSVVEYGFRDYQQYLSDRWDIQGNTIKELVRDSINDQREVYIAFHKQSEEVRCFQLEEIPGNKFVRRIIGFTDYVPSYSGLATNINVIIPMDTSKLEAAGYYGHLGEE